MDSYDPTIENSESSRVHHVKITSCGVPQHLRRWCTTEVRSSTHSSSTLQDRSAADQISHTLPSPSTAQDEYFMIPQSYTVGVHGYILVYSVTSKKR